MLRRCFAACLIVALALVISGVGSSLALSVGSATAQRQTSAHASTRIAIAANASYCNLLGAWSGLNSTDYNVSVHELWSKLCVEPLFQSVIDDWGGLILGHVGNTSNTTWVARNLTFGYGQHGNSPPVVDFTVDWLAACQNATLGPGQCSEQEWWEGNVTTLELTGPFTNEYRASSTAPPLTPGGSLFMYLLIGLVVAAGIGAILVVVWKLRGRRVQPPTSGVGGGGAR